MVSACTLMLDNVELTEQKRFVPDTLSSLFQESDRIEGTSTEGHAVIQYQATRKSILKRLDILGCTASLVENRFNEWREENISRKLEWIEGLEPERDPEVLALRELNWNEWLRRVPNILQTLYGHQEYSDEIDRRMRGFDSSWLWFDGFESLISLRGIIDGAHETQMVTLDIAPLISGGWINYDDQICAGKIRIVSTRGQPSGPTIILAEGSSDIIVLKECIPVFHPELVEFVTFLDHSEFKVDGGAGYVVKFLKAFAAAKVPSNIVAVFDNDAAGLTAYREACSLNLPCNIACIHLPEIEFARNYPSIGPQGCHRVNVNGKACSIELYLGVTSLSKNGKLRPVRWGGTVSGEYQGAVEDKLAVRDTFLSTIKTQGVDVNRDFPEMVLVWQSILDAASKIAEEGQRRARPPPDW